MSTIHVPDDLLAETMRLTKAESTDAGVAQALADFNKRQRLAELIASLGRSDTFMTYEELMADRQADADRSVWPKDD